MIEKYKVIDMADFYDNIPEQQMFLVLSSSSTNLVNVTRKVKISNRRLLSLEYDKQEEVCLLVKNYESDTYDILKVPYKDGRYRVDSIVEDICWAAVPVSSEAWESVISCPNLYTYEITLSDKAIMIDRKVFSLTREMKTLACIEVEGTDLFLDEIQYVKQNTDISDELFDKCVRGDSVSIEDFYPLIDHLEQDEKVIIEFDSIVFMVSDKEIVVRMFIGITDDVKEEFQFRISTSRVGGMVSMLFDKLVNSEPIEKKMKFLSDKIIY